MLAKWDLLEMQEKHIDKRSTKVEYHRCSARRHEEHHWRVQVDRHRVPELQAPAFVGNVCCRHLMLVHRHRMPALQAPVFVGNMCCRHRTPFGLYKNITEGGGVPALAESVILSLAL